MGKISQKGLNLITAFEGCRLTAYKAVPTEAYYTIGYGHYGPDVIRGMVITQHKAEELLKNDIKKFETKVNKYDPVYHWTQNEFDALVSFCYNIGSIDQLTNHGKRTKKEIYTKILAYNKSGGQVLAGLTRRRNKEASLFSSDGMKGDTISEYPTVKKGDSGEYVVLLQKILNEKKICGGNLKEDGIFGLVTLNAVIEFQALHGLTKDGIVGSKTWNKLNE